MELHGRESHGGGSVRDLAGGTVNEQANRPSWRRQSRHDLGSACKSHESRRVGMEIEADPVGPRAQASHGFVNLRQAANLDAKINTRHSQARFVS